MAFDFKKEYKEFYKKVFNVFDEPLFWIHLNVDYPFNLKGIRECSQGELYRCPGKGRPE